ncbi:globin domain-containing protein [Phaeobacter porticola]|uniref:Putative globin n=1 Tax=Phaeobacter porticola TaxID=1844006 RepID=A0A1L3I958_9RHOB|nr:globin domain-containing protein [Phaeobacter porticola]APG48694.1 putative globin [Phaeobacter porticola]
MITEHDKGLIRSSVESERMDLSLFVSRFYKRFFESCPDTRKLFPDDIALQEDKLLTSLMHIIEALDHPEKLSAILKQQGERHRAIQISDQHFNSFIQSFTGALAETLGPDWTAEVRDVWIVFLTDVVQTMNFLKPN